MRDDRAGHANDYVPDAGVVRAACLRLSLREEDLPCLLDGVCRHRIAPAALAALMPLLAARLESLRARAAEVAALAGVDPCLARRIAPALDRLRDGDAAALDDAARIFDDARRAREARAAPAAWHAALCAALADIAALQLDFRRAADCCAAAAVTPGLDAHLQQAYRVAEAVALEEQAQTSNDPAVLERAVARYASLSPGYPPLPGAERARVDARLAGALLALGERQHGTRAFEQALAAFDRALAALAGDDAVEARAVCEIGRGEALARLGRRRAEAGLLEQALHAFDTTLAALDPAPVTDLRMRAEDARAATLLTLGQINRDRRLLKQASEAYTALLRGRTRARMPLEWAATMDSLGTSLRLLGELRKGPRTFEQAIAAFHGALAERGRARVPEAWALTQNNLGAALHKLGERTADPRPLEAAVQAYQDALGVWTRERAPWAWAMTRANLGAARRAWAEIEHDADRAREALDDFGAVAAAFREASHAQYYELAVEQLALTRKLVHALDAAAPSGPAAARARSAVGEAARRGA